MNRTRLVKPGTILSGHIARYDVFIADDVVTVIDANGFVSESR